MFYSGFFFCTIKKREKEVIELGEWGSGEDLGDVEKGTIFKIYCMNFQYETFLKKKLSKNKLINKKKVSWTHKNICNTDIIFYYTP